MKIKKYLIAIAILGSMLFTACTPESINLEDEQQTSNIEKKSREIIQ